MQTEVDKAVRFICGLMRARRLSLDLVETFRTVLCEVMYGRYEGHWFPDKPCKGKLKWIQEMKIAQINLPVQFIFILRWWEIILIYRLYKFPARSFWNSQWISLLFLYRSSLFSTLSTFWTDCQNGSITFFNLFSSQMLLYSLTAPGHIFWICSEK